MDQVFEKHFKPKAHILTLLGEELIKSPVMAIYELIKNSYDADAFRADVIFKNIDMLEDAAIIVEDDGIGMTNDVIENVWLEPGTDYRKPINSETGLRQIRKSPLLERVPMGEKGVGRFAVHKLASKILLITRPMLLTFDPNSNVLVNTQLANYEIVIYINWNDFSQKKYLSDIPINWKIRENVNDFRFKCSSGTYIHLSGLKTIWTKGMARQLKGQTLSMLSPKVNEDVFKINLQFDQKWVADMPEASQVLTEAPYKIVAHIDPGFNLDFEYEFKLRNNPTIGTRSIKNDPNYNRNIKGIIRTRIEQQLKNKEYDDSKITELLENFDNSNLSFGSILFEFYSFDLDSRSLRDYSENPDLLKKVLKEHSGIKVYKGDLRIYDYGEPGNDWLGLDLKRIQSKEWFSNNQNIGYVYLDSELAVALIEKTNREGFIENDAYNLFRLVLEVILTEFKATRSVDRNKWLKFNLKASSELFESKVNNFKTLLETSNLNDSEKRKLLLEEANKLEEKYEDDKAILLIPAGVGMTASVALHEIEKLVPRMEESVRSVPFKLEIFRDQVDELKQYVEGIISVVRKGGKQDVDLCDAIQKSFNNYRLKLINRKIEYSIKIDNDIKTVKCDKRFLITILMNIIDNSIYWLDTIYKEEKNIYLEAFKEAGHVHIILADNGPGFKDDIEDIVRPFFSRKEDGIGIGLYLVDTIMMQYGKFNIITNKNQLNASISDKLNGAIVELVFSKNQ